MPVLFTSKGLIYLHRKSIGPSREEMEKEEHARRQKHAENELEEQKNIDRAISLMWLNSNANVEIAVEGKSDAYYTYGFLNEKAYGYKQITYKNLYTGIDLVYTFTNANKIGFEYSLKVKPNADLSLVKIKFGGDVLKIKTDSEGNLILRTSAGSTIHSIPVSYYGQDIIEAKSITTKVESAFEINKNTVSFSFPGSYDKAKSLIVDPFVSSTANLTGIGSNAGIAKDVDFDYAGNVYVTGGGNGQSYKLAKFNSAGVLQWTFNGVLTIPAWTFGMYYGGWVVDKTNGNIYLGQGFAPSGGHRVVRINTTGVYDNYITTANSNFLENWKMYWNCNNGNPQLLIAGGGTNSNNNFALCSPPSTFISPLNVTGIAYAGSTGWAQDIADVIIDPSTNSLYTIYGSLYGTPTLANKIYKNNSPYSGASVAWSIPSGFTTIQEIANRPYLVGPEIDNSCNVFAINSSYLFYWDGKNLKAINKATGATVGTPLLTTNTALMTGGIVADECNNVFVGSTNGTIKVYAFNGAFFDDAAKTDISIPGFATSSVFDLAYYESQKLLYASGNGFVASFDIAPYNCNSNIFTINVASNCGTLSATATISPAPPFGSIVTYVLYVGGQQNATNTTGVFSGLSPNVTYTIIATINLACSGVVTTTTFTLPGPVLTPTVVNTTCGNSNGSITIAATGGVAPYTYSKNGGAFQGVNSFNGLPFGLYTITVKDVNGCSNSIVANIVNSNGPSITFTKTDATCGSNTGTITATGVGGVAPLSYSINGVAFQTNNFFTGISAGTYTLTVKDATGCTNVVSVNIISASNTTVSAVSGTTFCNSNNGSILAVANGGAAPYLYSINGNTYQSNNIFTLLLPGTYTVTVKDANGCLSTVVTTVANSPAPTVSATTVAAACSNANGSITATANGGVSPLQYSINGVNFQSSNFFFGLTSGIYIVTVKDANNCTNFVSVTVASTNGPLVSAVSTVSACNTNSGTITATGIGGNGALQYSINGINFQSGTLFTGLAAGTYTLIVKDASGCMGGFVIVVPNATAPSVTAIVTPTACNISTGIITATGSLGAPPYQFSINNGINYQPGGVFNLLSTGPYTVIVKDANNCTSTVAVTVANVAGLSISATAISSSCVTNNGSITAFGLGGAAPLQYSINGIAYQGSNIFNLLGGGNYTVYVKMPVIAFQQPL
ncbi:MAG: hypothetical protein IPP29_10635 [Bacteroidetes bacterium]|nr:hypothetical protein [Bacteroidota bacterium]